MDPFDPDVWRRITPILDSLFDAPLARREAILDESCGGDLELRAAIERLVRSGETETVTLDRPAAELAAELLADTDRADERRPRAGDVLGGYEIRGLLGRGGMGEVYRAFHPTLEREVALKVLPAHLTGSAGARGRLVTEARAASKLDHPNVQTVYDAGETETGRVYLALALYEGPTLADRLSAEGPLEIDEALDVVRQVASGLAAAHGAGIVHRDVKPSNLIVQPDGRVKIIDFGIARWPDRDPAAGGGATYGTIAYMSPEQTRGDESDARVDVWAVGIVLYETLTGRRPFRAPDDRALIRAIRNDDPEPVTEARPDVPGSLGRVLDRCLRKDPADRYPDVNALRADLEAVAAPAARRGRPAGLALGAVVLAAVAAITVFGWSPWSGAANGLEDGVMAPATSMAVLPFVPVPPDSAGRRLGRELAVSVSANLDGLGPIRTADGPVVLAAIGRRAVPAGDTAAALAGYLAATSYLRGTLSLAGAEARIDAALFAAGTGAEIGRLAVTGPAGDVAALTDSVTLAVLRLVWRRGELPVPSYGALTTRSVPALRAYLDGELALGAGRYEEAVAAFDSAFAADSTFWYALWRSIYPRTYGEGLTIRDDRFAALYEHRDALPEPDRRLLEVGAVEGWSATLEALRRIVELFPSYWPGRWAYANFLVHTGPLGGLELDDARRALESVLERNPTFLAAWEHLLWIRVLQRDSAGAREALRRLEAAAAEGDARLRRDLLPTYRALVAAASGGLPPEGLRRKVEHILHYEGSMPPIFYALDLLIYGSCAAQVDVNRAVLATRPPAELAGMAELMLGWATACAGDWPAGTSIATETPPAPLASIEPQVLVQAYGLGVAGAWLGELPPARARTLRPTVALERTADDAERLWLDGILAFADGRSGSLDSARAALAGHPADHAERLAASLAGFALALAGDSAAAGRQLADLEEEAVETGAHYRYGRSHPWLTPLDRLAAGRWLAAGGDTTRALRMLGGAGAVLAERSGAMGPAFHLLAPRAALLRARIHAARGDTARAAHDYGTVLYTYEIPAPRLAGALEEARAFVRDHAARERLNEIVRARG